MQLTIYQRKQISTGLVMVAIGTAAGFFYIVFAGELNLSYSVINAVAIGFFISVVLAVFELQFFRRQVRRMSFIALLLLRSLFYLFAVLFITVNVLVISRIRRFGLSYGEVLQSEEFSDYLIKQDFYVVVFYSLLIMITFNFTRQLGRKLGQGVLFSYITGRYRTPVRQERIVVFLDLIGSKQIIEKLGSMKFHEFLNDWVYDITECIVRHSGVILHYVEDEVVVSWTMDKGLTNSNCVRAVLEVQNLLKVLRPKYHSKYGFTPGVRAAMHCGNVVRAEVGSMKTEIAAVGDTMNTVSRILNECHQNQTDILLSKDLSDKLKLPGVYEYVFKGEVPLKGKARPMNLYTIQLRSDV